MDKNKQVITPTVGMGATIAYGSDRYPWEVTKIISVRKIKAMECDAKVKDNPSKCPGGENWEITPLTDEQKKAEHLHSTFTLRKNGKWVEEGSSINYGSVLVLGHQSRYNDPSF